MKWKSPTTIYMDGAKLNLEKVKRRKLAPKEHGKYRNAEDTLQKLVF